MPDFEPVDRPGIGDRSLSTPFPDRGVATLGSAVVINKENQGALHVSKGWRSTGWAKLDSGLGEFPAQGGRVDTKLVAQLRHRFACQVPPRCRCELLGGEFAHRRPARDTSTLEVLQCCVAVDPESRSELANVDAGGVQVDQVVDLGAGQPPLSLEVGRSAIRACSLSEGPGQDLHGPGEVVRGFESRP